MMKWFISENAYAVFKVNLMKVKPIIPASNEEIKITNFEREGSPPRVYGA